MLPRPRSIGDAGWLLAPSAHRTLAATAVICSVQAAACPLLEQPRAPRQQCARRRRERDERRRKRMHGDGGGGGGGGGAVVARIVLGLVELVAIAVVVIGIASKLLHGRL